MSNKKTRIKPGSAIDKMKKETELRTLRMQFFHLDPKWENYIEIINDKKLCTEQTHIIDIWKMACLVEYGDSWPIEKDNELLLKYTNEVQNILARFEKRPTTVVLDQVWYLYFATGEYRFLKLSFESAGFVAATQTLRDDALLMFETIREKYMEKITEAKQHDPNYFVNHPVANVRSAESNWIRLDEEIKVKMEQLGSEDPIDNEIDELIAAQYKFVSDADAQKTPEELVIDAQVNRGIDIFNKLLSMQ